MYYMLYMYFVVRCCSQMMVEAAAGYISVCRHRTMSQNIKVVVRVRSFIDREKSEATPCIVKMEGQSTTLYDLR